MNHDDRLIVALDFPTMEQAKAVVLELEVLKMANTLSQT